MNRSNKSKIAVTLLGALAFGANAQAKDNKNMIVKTNDFQINSTNSVQNSGKLGQVTGIVKEANWGKRALVITVGSLLGLEIFHSAVGGFTDSKLGRCSLGRLIRDRVKKNNKPDLGNPDEKEGKEEKEVKEVDEKAIIEKMSNKFNVIQDKNGNVDKQKINLFKEALVEILKLGNNDELNKYSNVEFNLNKSSNQPVNKSSNQPEKLKFVDFVKGFIDVFKQGRVTIEKTNNIIFRIYNASDGVTYFYSAFSIDGDVLNFLKGKKRLFKFSKGGQLEILPE